MRCSECEKLILKNANLRERMDRMSLKLDLTQDLLKKSQQNEQFCLADRDKIIMELVKLKARMT